MDDVFEQFVFYCRAVKRCVVGFGRMCSLFVVSFVFRFFFSFGGWLVGGRQPDPLGTTAAWLVVVFNCFCSPKLFFLVFRLFCVMSLCCVVCVLC